MADSIQRNSTVPLPYFQTEQGTHDPLPLNAPKELGRTEDVVRRHDRDVDHADFEHYLEQSSITLVKKAASDRLFDPLDAIADASVHVGADDKTRL